MPDSGRRRADARRNERALLAAAAAVFVTSGVDAPVRDIAAAAGVGMGTIYRHFPTRADLVIAVYRHQVEACADAGPALLASRATRVRRAGGLDRPVRRLPRHQARPRRGAAVRQRPLRQPCTPTSSTVSCPYARICSPRPPTPGRSGPTLAAYALMRGVGNLCIDVDNDPRYDARAMVGLLLDGLASA